MLSSCHRSISRWLAVGPVATCGLMLVPGPALAADTYVQPLAEFRVEAHDNFDLDSRTGTDSDTYGAVANLSALIGIATPRSDTSIRPRLRLQEYADRKEVTNYEAFLDLRSEYQSERSEWLVIGHYDRRDSVNAEFSDAAFDELDPDDPTTPENGARQYGVTRQRLDIRPTYTYRISERTSVGGRLFYQGMRYSSQAPLTRVDYDYAQGDGFITWSLGPRSDFRFRAYVSNYDAKDGPNQTDAYGGGLAYAYRWSEVTGTEVEVVYERDEITYDPSLVTESTSGWGATIAAYRKGEVSHWRLAAGRIFTPTGRGGKSTSDQFRVQYIRSFSERLEFDGAARYVANSSIGRIGASSDRDYARVDLSLRWAMTPTWYLGGGYTYRWQDRKSTPGSAGDNQIFLSIGYQALGR